MLSCRQVVVSLHSAGAFVADTRRKYTVVTELFQKDNTEGMSHLSASLII